MDQETQELLGFPEALLLVQGFAQTALGRDEIDRWRPVADLSRIRRRHQRIEEVRHYSTAQGRPSLRQLEDVRPLLTRLSRPGALLEPPKFLLLQDYFKVGQRLKKSFDEAEWPRLHSLTASIPDFGDLISEIQKTFDESGEIRDGAHPELGKVRRRQQQSRDKVRDYLGSLFKDSGAADFIDEPFVTMRNERFVVPVRAGRQRNVAGVVHGTSSSGASVFLEPIKAVDLNNRYAYNLERERELILRILTRLTDRITSRSEALGQLLEVVARIDSLFAVGDFAEACGCILPDYISEPRLELREARHPLLMAEMGREKVVPIDLLFSQGVSGLAISGPNTGGKTLALKTLGLLSLMAQSGFPIPASKAVLPLFHQVLADIGDHQSIAEGLSTFSAHIGRIQSILDQARDLSLVLIDEIGTGTDPVHGAALAVALMEYLLSQEVFFAVTTHHQAVKTLASTDPRLENAGVELDADGQAPTYRILYGRSVASSGLQMAQRLGLAPEVVARARELLDDTDRQAELYLERLRKEEIALQEELAETKRRRLEWEDERRRLNEEAAAERIRVRKAAEKAIEHWAREFQKQAGGFLQTLKDRFESAKMRSQLQRKQALLKEEFRRRVQGSLVREGKRATRRSPTAVQVGDTVRHLTFRKAGLVLSLENDQAQVDFQGKRMTCRLDQIEAIQSPAEKGRRRLPPNIRLEAVQTVSEELNLIGQTIDEALQQADKYLDRAAVASLRQVRIVHGHGTGRLRKALHDFLKGHPHVASYSSQGGATLVSLEHDK